MSSSVIPVTSATFEEVTHREGLVLLNFWSTSCGPCLRFRRVFSTAAEALPEATFAQAEIELQQKLVTDLEISTIPSLLIYRDGELIYRDPTPGPGPGTFSTVEDAPRFLDVMYRPDDFIAFVEKL